MIDVNLEFLNDGRSDPACTDFIARKESLVEDGNAQAALAQPPGTGRPRGTSSDNQDIVLSPHVRHLSAIEVIEMFARPGDFVVARGSTDDLEQLEFVGLKSSNRTGEVKSPNPNKGFVEHPTNTVDTLFKSV